MQGLRGKRAKRTVMLTALCGAVIAMIVWMLPWANLTVDINGIGHDIAGTGEGAAFPLIAFALAVLAAVGVLAIAPRPVSVMVTGVILLGLAALMVRVTLNGITDPASAVLDEVQALSALSTDSAAREIVSTGTLTPTIAPWFSLFGSVVVAVSGILALVTARTWPHAGKKYDTQTTANRSATQDASESGRGRRDAGSSAAHSSAAKSSADQVATGQESARDREAARRIDQWDALTDGEDPTN